MKPELADKYHKFFNHVCPSIGDLVKIKHPFEVTWEKCKIGIIITVDAEVHPIQGRRIDIAWTAGHISAECSKYLEVLNER